MPLKLFISVAGTFVFLALFFTGSGQPLGQHQYYDVLATRFSKIITTRNGDIVTVFLSVKPGGGAGTEEYSTIIQRTDAGLNVVWSRTFPGISVAEIIEARNGDFVFSGSELLTTASGNRNMVSVIRIGNDGTLRWRYNGRFLYPAYTGSVLDADQRIAETKSEKIYFQYKILLQAPTEHAAFCIGRDGALLWTRRMVYPAGFSFTDLTTTFDDQLLISGTLNTGLGGGSSIMVIDSLGRFQFSKKIGGGSRININQIVKDTAARQYYFCGDFVDRNNLPQAMVCKADFDLLGLSRLPSTVARADIFKCFSNQTTYGIDGSSHLYCLYINRDGPSNNRKVYDATSAGIQIPAYKFDSGLNVIWRKRYLLPSVRGGSTIISGVPQLVVLNDKVLAGMETPNMVPGINLIKKTAWLLVTDTAGDAGRFCAATPETFTFAKNSLTAVGDRTNFVFPGTGIIVPSQNLVQADYTLNRKDTCTGKSRPTGKFHYYQTPASTYFPTIVCTGADVSFVDSSYGEPQTWQWIFPPEADLGNADSSCFPDIYKVHFTRPGTFPVKLVVENGQGVDTFTKYITVIDFIPQPALGSDTSICPGDSVLLIHTDVPYSGHYFFGLDSSFRSVKDTIVIKTPGRYVCAAYSACGIQYDTITVQIAARPVAQFEPFVTCGSLTVSFFNFSLLSGNPSLSYQWQFLTKNNVVLGTSFLQNPSFTYAAYDTVKVRLIVAGPLACAAQDTMEKTFVLRVKPVASFTLTERCGSLQASFVSHASVAGDTITGYSWLFGDGGSSTAINPTHTYAAVGTYPVQLVAISSGGCTDTALMALTLRTKPVAGFTYGNNACEGQLFTLSDSSTVTGSSIAGYHWYIPSAGQAYTTASIQPLISIAGPTLILYTVTSAQGCISDTFMKTILVESLPVAGFTASNGCAGQTILFTSGATTSVGTIAAYQWNTSNSLSSAQQSALFSFAAAGIYTVRHKVVSGNGCVSNEAVKTITVFALPQPSFVHTLPCLDNTVSFTNTTPDPSGNSWQWKINNSVFSTGVTAAYRFTGPGNYTISLQATTTDNCTATFSKVLPVEDFRLRLTSSKNPLISGDEVVLRTTVPVPYTVLGWKPAALFPAQTLKMQRLLIDSSQGIEVTAQSAAGCRDTASLQLLVNFLDDIYIPSAFTPDGDGRNETLRVRGNIKELDFKIFNRWGQMVFSSKDKTKGWDGRMNSTLQPAGTYVYLAKIVKGNGQVVEKKGTVTLIK